jgi:hypothetical protein
MPPSPFRYSEALGDLHDRYHAVKLARPSREVAQEVGVSTLTLHRFERQGYVTALTLHQIAQWVHGQERAHDRPRGYER